MEEDRLARNIGVGCFTFFIGAVSCAMIGVGIGKAVGYFTRCTPAEGLPACNWWVYAGWGALLGAVTLPTVVLWRLRRTDRERDRAAGASSSRG